MAGPTATSTHSCPGTTQAERSRLHAYRSSTDCAVTTTSQARPHPVCQRVHPDVFGEQARGSISSFGSIDSQSSRSPTPSAAGQSAERSPREYRSAATGHPQPGTILLIAGSDPGSERTPSKEQGYAKRTSVRPSSGLWRLALEPCESGDEGSQLSRPNGVPCQALEPKPDRARVIVDIIYNTRYIVHQIKD